VKVDGELRRLDEEHRADKKYKHDIAVVVDRLVMKHDLRKRLADSIETAVALADGSSNRDGRRRQEPRTLTFSEKFACPVHGPSLVELEPRISPSTRRTGLPAVHGLGRRWNRPELVVPIHRCRSATGRSRRGRRARQLLRPARAGDLGALRRRSRGPWDKLPRGPRLLLYAQRRRLQVSYRNRFGRRRRTRTRRADRPWLIVLPTEPIRFSRRRARST